MYDTVRTYFCPDVTKIYDDCCWNNKLTFPFTCNDQKHKLDACFENHLSDAGLYQSLASEYLRERSHFRQSGIPTRRYIRGVFVSRLGEDSQGQYTPRKP